VPRLQELPILQALCERGWNVRHLQNRISLLVCDLVLGTGLAFGAPTSNIHFDFSADGFFATGSWESPDPTVKTDMTETQIDCFRQTKMCVLATADNILGRPHIETNYLDVIQWTSNGLIATDSSPICMTLTMQVSAGDKHVTLMHSMKKLAADQAKACKFFGASESAEDLFVLKGSPRWEKEHEWIPKKD
jgi:hypothetical protein